MSCEWIASRYLSTSAREAGWSAGFCCATSGRQRMKHSATATKIFFICALLPSSFRVPEAIAGSPAVRRRYLVSKVHKPVIFSRALLHLHLVDDLAPASIRRYPLQAALVLGATLGGAWQNGGAR